MVDYRFDWSVGDMLCLLFCFIVDGRCRGFILGTVSPCAVRVHCCFLSRFLFSLASPAFILIDFGGGPLRIIIGYEVT